MFRIPIACVVFFLALAATGNVLAVTQPQSADDMVLPGRLYVQFTDDNLRFSAGRIGRAAFDVKADQYQVTAIEKAFPNLDVMARHRPLAPSTEALRRVYVMHYDAANSPRQAAVDFTSVPGVRFAEPIYKKQLLDPLPLNGDEPQATPNDPQYSSQIHLPYIQLDDAWDVVKGENSTVVIAIVDGGTDWEHEDLLANVWTNPNETAGDGIDNDNNGFIDDIHGWNFLNSTPNPKGEDNTSNYFHGTMVAGSAAAVTNNSKGVAGASWNAKFMALNTSCGGAQDRRLCSVNPAVTYAAMNGADVITASFGSYEVGFVDEMVFQSATDQGAVVVAGAGNNRTDNDTRPHYPASFPVTLSVGGITSFSDLSLFNYGKSVNVFAPSQEIHGTTPDNTYATSSGTSIAVPLVAGVAALVKTAFPQFDAHQIREQIRLTAVSIDGTNAHAGKYGRGKVDAHAAVTASSLPAIRITNWSYQNQFDYRDVRPSDTVTVDVVFTNYHANGSGLSAQMTSGSSFLTWITPTVSLGTMNKGDSFSATYSFTFASSAPAKGALQLSPQITASGLNDSPDVLLIPFDDFSISIEVSPTWLGEGDGPTEITITLTSTKLLIDPPVIPFMVTGSGVEGAVDFINVTEVRATMPHTQVEASVQFTLTPIDDQEKELDETITISSTSPQVSNTATITLYDNESPITLSIHPPSAIEGDGSTTITVTATSTLPYQDAQVLPITVAGSGAADAVDFTDVPGFDLTLAANEKTVSGTFILTPADDQEYEQNEIITISSTNPLVSNTATFTLYDDDVETPIVLSVDPLSVSEGDGSTTITVTATSTTTFTDAQVLPITVSGSGAVEAVDFAAVPGFDLSLVANETTANGTFTLTPTDNLIDEVDEAVTISSSHALVTQSATITLTDDDDPPTGISLSVYPVSVSERDGDTTITVTGTVTGGTTYGAAQSLDLKVEGSGTTGVVGFAPVSGLTLSLAAGAGSGSTTFTLSPIDDADIAADETITISSSNPLVSDSAMITLYDDDGSPIRLSVEPMTISEGDGATTITVTATSNTPFTDAQVLSITVTGSGVAEAVDFASVPGFDLTLATNESTADGTFTLAPIDDVVDEMSETLSITSSHMQQNLLATLTLQDDDNAPDGVTLSVSPDDIREDGGATTITVTAMVSGTTLYASEKVMNVTMTNTGVMGAVDYAPVSEFSLSVAVEAASGTASFVLTPENDEVGEADETITISSDSTFVLSDAMLVIRDDDGGRTGRDTDAEEMEFSVAPPYPNPASGMITFMLSSPEPAEWTRLRLYNVLGQEVAVPYEGTLRAGQHTVQYDGGHLPAGVYVYVMESANTRVSGQLIIAQ